MKKLLCSIVMAFSMFSVIPMPMVEWKPENMKYMLCALPLVGIVIAAALWLWQMLCAALGFGTFLYAAGLTLIPVGISGGIHLDGYCDTVDALSSHAEPQRKREILKDPRSGAFALIFTAAWFTAYFALCTECGCIAGAAAFVGLSHVLARALGALAGVAFPGSGSPGLLTSFRDASSRRAALLLALWCAFCAGAMALLSPVSGLVCAGVSAILLVYIYRMSRREFGGMSGDIAGYLITVAELALLCAYIFTEKAVALCF